MKKIGARGRQFLLESPPTLRGNFNGANSTLVEEQELARHRNYPNLLSQLRFRSLVIPTHQTNSGFRHRNSHWVAVFSVALLFSSLR